MGLIDMMLWDATKPRKPHPKSIYGRMKRRQAERRYVKAGVRRLELNDEIRATYAARKRPPDPPQVSKPPDQPQVSKPPVDARRWVKPALYVFAVMLVVYLVGGAAILAVRFWPVTIAILAGLTAFLWMRHRAKVRQMIADRADLQHQQYLAGDDRGVYGP